MKSGRRIGRIWTTLILTVVTVQLVAGCGRSGAIYSGHFKAFGGQVDITLVDVPRHEAADAIEALSKDFAYLEENWWTPSGDPLARTNDLLATGETFSASPSLLPLLETAKRLADSSGGLLNPALGRLLELWGFYSASVERFRPPSASQITELVARRPSVDSIIVDDIRIRGTNPAVALDFHGFLKGYAIDHAISLLREMGIENASVNVGGDLRAIGSRASHPWNVALRRPDGTGVLATLDIAGDESVVTMGAYERYLTWQGEKYHHILDPRTGWPAVGAHSVTVIHPSATTAHAAATALFVAGPDAWPGVASRMGVDQVMLVDNTGTMHMTRGLENRVRFLARKPPLRMTDLPPREDPSS